MPFARPTLDELVDRIQTDVKQGLAINALLRRSVTGVLSRALAGAVHSVLGFAQFISEQIIWDTAENEFLERWASLFDITRLSASFSTGNVTFTGTSGVVIPAGTTLQTSDGVEYTTDAEGTITGGTATVAVTATVAGTGGNLDAGESLSFSTPIAGVSTATTASGGLTGGTNTETDTDLRARFLDRVRNPPQGGSINDYIIWAKTVAGVTRVWVYANNPTVNEVTVLFVRDNDDTGVGADILPSAGEISSVQTVLTTEAPITSVPVAAAPTHKELDIDITLVPNTTSVQNAVLAELADLIKREAEPGGADNAENGGTIFLSRIDEAISRAEGETDHTITAVNGTTPADATVVSGEMYKLGTINFS